MRAFWLTTHRAVPLLTARTRMRLLLQTLVCSGVGSVIRDTDATEVCAAIRVIGNHVRCVGSYYAAVEAQMTIPLRTMSLLYV